ncbi:MAG TPA: carboxy terminal-processing peptidase [Opitutaceae bacterium]|nr:carboxy terminal-processing peptidase [Opitutaceae bacterium]
MKFPLPTRHFAPTVVFLGLLTLWVPSSAEAQRDRGFSTPATLTNEVKHFVRLLEEVHYNRDSVKPRDYASVIPDFMGELDGQRLFFLASDKEAFLGANPSDRLYWNITTLGKIDYAYEIFTRYEERTRSRITWIFDELQKPFDLSTTETYAYDRSKAEWPATPEAADELWRRRLKFELVSELLGKKAAEDPAALDAAKTKVRKRYERMLKNVAEIESLDLAEMFLSTLARLYDPHSTYFSSDTYEDFNIQMRLQLVGIGAMLSLEDDVCVVKEIVPGGPADISKLIKPNDKIISVGQVGAEPVEIIGMKLRKIVDLIRGGKGTKVHLSIQPADATDSSVRREVVLTRDVVKLDSARAFGAIFEVPDAEGNLAPIGVITLPTFYGPDGSAGGPDSEQTSATGDVAKLIAQMQAAGIKGLVLDLRRNGGGLLSEAIDLTGLFIQRGPVVQVQSYYREIKVDEDEDPRIAYSGPLAVLVSRFSASASEIVAGALQNYGRAVVVGDSSTHGKGTVQTVVEMRNVIPSLARAPVKTGAAKFTVQKFYLPSGSSTQLKGVIPDITLPSIDDYLPIGEKDLPHALVWDEIPSSFFDGKPLAPSVLSPLRDSSVARQQQLEEFSYLRKSIDFFKSKQEQKQVSLNLEERRRQKEVDDAFKKEMDAEKARLAQNDFKFREFLLAPPPPPRIKAAPSPDDVDDPTELSTDDDNARYGKMDVHLRESLRVLADALALGKQRELWTGDTAPLTAHISKKGGSPLVR